MSGTFFVIQFGEDGMHWEMNKSTFMGLLNIRKVWIYDTLLFETYMPEDEAHTTKLMASYHMSLKVNIRYCV